MSVVYTTPLAASQVDNCTHDTARAFTHIIENNHRHVLDTIHTVFTHHKHNKDLLVFEDDIVLHDDFRHIFNSLVVEANQRDSKYILSLYDGVVVTNLSWCARNPKCTNDVDQYAREHTFTGGYGLSMWVFGSQAMYFKNKVCTPLLQSMKNRRESPLLTDRYIMSLANFNDIKTYGVNRSLVQHIGAVSTYFTDRYHTSFTFKP